MSLPSTSPRKISNSLLILIACMLGVGIGLFGINYWHTTQCSSDRSPQELEDMIDALNRRLLQSESQVHKNEILVNKVIKALESNLYQLERKELEDITKKSKDEAVKIALYLASHPAPVMPDFPLAEEYNSMEKIADLVDDLYSRSSKDDDKLSNQNVFGGDANPSKEEEHEVLTDTEAENLCNEWKIKYKVIVGVSWGDLPYDLQQKWLSYSCDYHMKGDKEKIIDLEEEEENPVDLF